MNKEQVVQIIERRQSGRIPIWYDYFAEETKAKYGAQIDKLLAEYPDDLTVCLLPEQDWGVCYEYAAGGVGKHVSFNPLASWDDYDAYMRVFPDPTEAGLLDQIKRAREKQPDQYLMGGWWNLLFERFHYLRGMDNALVDLILETERTSALLDKLEEYFTILIERFAREAGADGLLFGDDFGMQDRMMMSPDLFRRLFKPRMARLVRKCHNLNMHVCLHSCGNIADIIGDLVEIGVDILHPLQPGTMDNQKIIAEHGSSITFFAGIDVQSVIINGNETEIWQEVETLFRLFKRKDGGFMATSANTIMPETPLANIKTLFQALTWYAGKETEEI